MREREIIKKLFQFPTTRRDIEIGIGDDACALLLSGEQSENRLLVSTDTLVEGVHFFADLPPDKLAWRAAAVSLSDMAAMGAHPQWMTVALSVPPKNNAAESWFADFADGLAQSAEQYHYNIVGGDLTRSPTLTVTTTIIGRTDHPPLTRGGAQVGDDIWVSGTLGGAALAVLARHNPQWRFSDLQTAINHYEKPTPRLQLGWALVGIATACMDISDGVISCAHAIAECSQCQLQLTAEQLPMPATLQHAPPQTQQQCLYNSDDYELFWTASPRHRPAIVALSTPQLPLTRIGTVQAGAGVQLKQHQQPLDLNALTGYEHQF